MRYITPSVRGRTDPPRTVLRPFKSQICAAFISPQVTASCAETSTRRPSPVASRW